MKLKDLYTRTIETTGLDVITMPSLLTAVSNCFADLSSRGYRTFKEVHLEQLINKIVNKNMITFSSPANLRKVLYIRAFFNNFAVKAERCQLSNPSICSVFDGDKTFRTPLRYGDVIFYIKDKEITIEWDPELGDLVNITMGYNEGLKAPKFNPDLTEEENLETIDINIREEYEDALVFYSAYFYYSRYIKDPERIQHFQSNYKYFVEDISHELAYEDDFNGEDAVIKVEEM